MVGVEHRTSAGGSEGARDAIFQRPAHPADGRGGYPTSGIEIAISGQVGRAKVAEVTRVNHPGALLPSMLREQPLFGPRDDEAPFDPRSARGQNEAGSLGGNAGHRSFTEDR
jgi:hypothetical protein